MKIGQKIKFIREAKNFTQEYVAEQLGLTQPNYSKLERDEIELSVNRLEKISNVLGIKIEDLINLNEQNVFNNYNSNQGNQAYNIINFAEKELYEKHILSLEKEIESLKSILDKILSK